MGIGFFSLFEVLFFLVFALILGVILASLVRSAKNTHRNNQSPRLSVEASVVSRRTQLVHHHSTNMDMAFDNSYNEYFVTFQFPSGDRMELRVSAREYGMLVEGDHGMLSLQGTRYLGFTRT